MKSEWKTGYLSTIAEINPKEKLKKGTIAKKVSMDKLQPFYRNIHTFECTEYVGGAKFRNGDTIMARITPCLEDGKTAMVNILEEDEIGFGSTEYIVFRARKNTDPNYLYYLITSPYVRNAAIKSMTGSSGRQRVQLDIFNSLEIRIPDLAYQKVVGRYLSMIDDKIELNNQINGNLTA